MLYANEYLNEVVLALQRGNAACVLGTFPICQILFDTCSALHCTYIIMYLT